MGSLCEDLDCFNAEIKSQLSGYTITVHNAYTHPDVNNEGINLLPGTLTEIKLKTIENIWKSPPHGHCSPNTPRDMIIQSNDNDTYVYSEYACRGATIQAY
ncbi:unnamed protein product [Protopolystoma xenopodis]|uniref:Uncharacterized protein n=1 Tax=Protopolystoma xenopodis TaxID=117903 RepID=A0A448WNM8_9PLAT|nr:unnamed protein product [Protopolystoma xenopodis]